MFNSIQFNSIQLWLALLRFFVLRLISCRWSSKFSTSKGGLSCNWWEIYLEDFSVFDHFCDIAPFKRFKTYLSCRCIPNVFAFVSVLILFTYNCLCLELLMFCDKNISLYLVQSEHEGSSFRSGFYVRY